MGHAGRPALRAAGDGVILVGGRREARVNAGAVTVEGADRQVVGQIAAEVRAIRPPEPYKGKGIRYSDERVVLKETKKK